MDIEILRKIVELCKKFEIESIVIPEGNREFKIRYLIGMEKTCPYDVVYFWDRYPELLRDALEQWNKKNPEHKVVWKDLGLEITDWIEGTFFRFKDYPGYEKLSSKEKALEACLIELVSEDL